ncbi:MAG: hypothetical protein ACOCUF_01860 [Patescibacteria group bacterium]
MAQKNQPSRTGTGHGTNRCRPGGGKSFHDSGSGSSGKSPAKSGKTGNTKGGGSKRSKP